MSEGIGCSPLCQAAQSSTIRMDMDMESGAKLTGEPPCWPRWPRPPSYGQKRPFPLLSLTAPPPPSLQQRSLIRGLSVQVSSWMWELRMQAMAR